MPGTPFRFLLGISGKKSPRAIKAYEAAQASNHSSHSQHSFHTNLIFCSLGFPSIFPQFPSIFPQFSLGFPSTHLHGKNEGIMWDLCGLRHTFYQDKEGSFKEALRRFQDKTKKRTPKPRPCNKSYEDTTATQKKAHPSGKTLQKSYEDTTETQKQRSAGALLLQVDSTSWSVRRSSGKVTGKTSSCVQSQPWV